MFAWKITLLVLGSFCLMATEASSHGSWIEGDVDEAIARSGRSDTRALVFVTASWCPACQALKKDVMEAPVHQELLDEFVRVRVDFDEASSHRWVEELVILGLPTVVVLDTQGKPVGRIRGYTEAASWTAELSRLRADQDRRAELERAAQAHGADTTAKLELARLLLERGEAQTALPVLRALSATDEPSVAPEALFVLGRYFHRVKRDPVRARPIWRELAVRFPDSPAAPGAWWWYARAEAESGHAGGGARALLDAANRRPEDAARVLTAAAFVRKHPQLISVVGDELFACVTRTLARTTDTKERGSLEALRAKLVHPVAN